MQTSGERTAHADACETCKGCERCRWVATRTKATHVIEVKVKVRHFCEHHGINVPERFIMKLDDGTWFTEPELRLPRVRKTANPFTWITAKMHARVDLMTRGTCDAWR